MNVSDLGEDASDHVKNVVKGLGLGNGRYLIAIAWTTKEQRKWHMKFPFLLGHDETFRTNAEKRALARLCGKTMNNKIITFVDAFLPSKQRWVFNWLWQSAYPSLLDKQALAKTAIILVDQDEHNWQAMESNLFPRSNVYGKAVGRLCKWHKVVFVSFPKNSCISCLTFGLLDIPELCEQIQRTCHH